MPEVEVEERLIGGAAIRATGKPLPDETLDACRAATAVLKGPVGDPEFDAADVRPEQGLLALARCARRVRESAAGGARRRRRADRARARRRPVLRCERRARGRDGLRHVRISPAPGRADRAARVPPRAVARRPADVGRQGERARDLAHVAARRRRARARVSRREGRAHARRQRRDAARDGARAVRRARHREHVRRHPLRPRGGDDRRPRARAVGEPLRRRPWNLRAGARLGSRHCRPRRREPDGDAALDGVAARARPRPAGARRRRSCGRSTAAIQSAPTADLGGSATTSEFGSAVRAQLRIDDAAVASYRGSDGSRA